MNKNLPFKLDLIHSGISEEKCIHDCEIWLMFQALRVDF